MYGLPICDLEDDVVQQDDESKKTLSKIQSGLPEHKEFSYRVTAKGAPEGQDFLEAVIRGINKRKELGLFQNLAAYFSEIQLLLVEVLRLYKDSEKKQNIITAFQNYSNACVTKEASPRIVTQCYNCQSFIPFQNLCGKCKNAFYCDQSCMRAQSVQHASNCLDTIPKIPKV